MYFPQPTLERAVIDAGRLGGAGDLLHRLGELLNALRHGRLVARDLFGPLRGLERHRALLLSTAGVRPSTRPAVRITVSFRRQVARPIAQLALRRRHGIAGTGRRVRRLARLRA